MGGLFNCASIAATSGAPAFFIACISSLTVVATYRKLTRAFTWGNQCGNQGKLHTARRAAVPQKCRHV